MNIFDKEDGEECFKEKKQHIQKALGWKVYISTYLPTLSLEIIHTTDLAQKPDFILLHFS